MIADTILNAIIWFFQKLILPILPINLPFLSFAEFQNLLSGSVKHNLIYSFSGITELFNFKLLFIVLIAIIFAELLLWLIRAGLFIVKLVRG